MSKKIDRAVHGPSGTEIILGIVFSLALGIVLGAVLMIIKPVVVVKEQPKEPDPKAVVTGMSTVYYIEGSRETGKARQASAKRTAFLQGESVSVTEDELNALAPTPAAPATPAALSPKAGEKPAAPPAPAMLATGPVNFRIRDGELQIAAPVTINAAGFAQKVIVQARGGFVKEADQFVYRPNTLYVGSCPVQRLPYVADFLREKFMAAQAVPEDLAAAWAKATDVTVEGNSLNVTMQ